MRRRVTVFGLVWAFAMNALWVPSGLDGGYLLSVFFPAWYLFLLGLTIGVAHEFLATRWSRLWVWLAVSITLTEASVALFGGNVIGLRLALPVALAIAIASKAATMPRLTRHRFVPTLGRLLLGIAAWTLFRTAACAPYWNVAIQEKVSPDGAYIARVEREIGGALSSDSPAVHIGPRYAPPTWFGSIAACSYKIRWEDTRTLGASASRSTHSRYLNVKVKPLYGERDRR
jgi:hypothetical protein